MSLITASCQFLMCEGLLPWNVCALMHDVTLATATVAQWMASCRYLPAVIDIHHRIPLTHSALYTPSQPPPVCSHLLPPHQSPAAPSPVPANFASIMNVYSKP